VKLLEKLPLASRKLIFSATYTKSIMKDIVMGGNFMYVHTLKKIDGKMDIFMSENPLEFCELKN
jgi:fructose-1,6-bisphosphatase